MSNDLGRSASRVAVVRTSQYQQVSALSGIKAATKKDQDLGNMLQESQRDLQSVTPTRGNKINIVV